MSGVPASPYRGIRPFRFADHPIFFARERETRQLTRLMDVYRGVFLYGASGNGKSSLVQAGLLPAVLDLGFDPVLVRVQPREHEEIVIERIARGDDGSELLECTLIAADDESPRSVLSLAEFERGVRAASEHGQPLIVFDQFEELVTLFDDAAELRSEVADLIVRLLRAPLPVKLLMAFREDYLGSVKQLLAARPELVDQALRLGPPPADALATIIRGPFHRFPGEFGNEIDGDLADTLVAALAARFGTEVSLSELQTVCMRLWRAEDPAALFAAKGVQGLLEDDLGDALATLSPNVREAAIALLSELVTSARTRNVIAADDLTQRVRDAQPELASDLLYEALRQLEAEARLVRRERRRDIYLYEITSEFLVPWISERREEARLVRQRRRDEAQREEQRREQSRARRALLLRSSTAGLLVIAAVIGAFAVLALRQRGEAQRSEAEARQARDTAVTARMDAETQRVEAEQQGARAQRNAFDAGEQRRAARRSATAAERDRAAAIVTAVDARRERARAIASASDARRLGRIAERRHGEASSQRAAAEFNGRLAESRRSVAIRERNAYEHDLHVLFSACTRLAPPARTGECGLTGLGASSGFPISFRHALSIQGGSASFTRLGVDRLPPGSNLTVSCIVPERAQRVCPVISRTFTPGHSSANLMPVLFPRRAGGPVQLPRGTRVTLILRWRGEDAQFFELTLRPPQRSQARELLLTSQ